MFLIGALIRHFRRLTFLLVITTSSFLLWKTHYYSFASVHIEILDGSVLAVPKKKCAEMTAMTGNDQKRRRFKSMAHRKTWSVFDSQINPTSSKLDRSYKLGKDQYYGSC